MKFDERCIETVCFPYCPRQLLPFFCNFGSNSFLTENNKSVHNNKLKNNPIKTVDQVGKEEHDSAILI